MFYNKENYKFETVKPLTEVIGLVNETIEEVDSLMKIKWIRSLRRPFIGVKTDNTTYKIMCNTYYAFTLRPVAKISMYEENKKTIVDVSISALKWAKVFMTIFICMTIFFATMIFITISFNVLKNGFGVLKEYWVLSFLFIYLIVFKIFKGLYIKEKGKILSAIQEIINDM